MVTMFGGQIGNIIIKSVLKFRTTFNVITAGTKKGQEIQATVGDNATCFDLNHFLVNQSVPYPDLSSQ